MYVYGNANHSQGNQAFPLFSSVRSHLRELPAQNLADMPQNVAKNEPRTRVVCREAHDEVAACGQYASVSTDGVIELEIRLATIPDAVALANDMEVVAVNLDLVRQIHRITLYGLDRPKGPPVLLVALREGDDVCSLANIDCDRIGDTRLDRHEVGCNDGEVVFVDIDMEMAFDASADQT